MFRTIVMDNNSLSSNIAFTSRCSQIRDAQWVCRKVRSFPHISTTYWNANVVKLAEQNFEIYDRFMHQSQVNRYIPKDPHAIKCVKIFSWYKRLVKNISKARREWDVGGNNSYRRVNNILGQFRYEKLGNCGEDAYLAASILKMNGVENACVATLKADGDVQDHVVCLFNKDGSQFDNENLKKTIIIDPWLGVVDFASNMSVKYKNLFLEKLGGLTENSNISFQKYDDVDFSERELRFLKLSHPNLCFPTNSKKKFMQ